jgi:glycosyltransferase involved in cell wall biosynthesis
MVQGKKLTVVLPAYNAEQTLERTYHEIPRDIVDTILVVDDNSRDKTVELAKRLGLKVIVHPQNKGYGGNQKTCYQDALDEGSDIIIMLHPDYQYTPLLIPCMAHMLASGLYDVVLGSRILGGRAMQGGMPLYKYVAREVLEQLPWQNNSDDFIFDNQFLAQTIFAGFKIGEVSCPTKYFEEASSINFTRSLRYGFGCMFVAAIKFWLARIGVKRSRIFEGLGA